MEAERVEVNRHEAEVLNELREDAAKASSLAYDIALLQGMLDMKQRQLSALFREIDSKQDAASIKDAEKRQLGELLRDMVLKAPIPPRDEYAEMICFQDAVEKGEIPECQDALVYFDQPKDLQVTACYGDGSRVVVNIIKSLEAEPANIGHPLVTLVLRRYAKLLLHPNEEARRLGITNLQRIVKTIISVTADERRRRDRLVADYNFALEEAELPHDYFETVWRILHETDVITGRTPSTRCGLIKAKLTRLYPDFDHQKVLDFLRLKENELPRRGGGAALKNAFFGDNRGTTSASVSTRRSRFLTPLLEKLQPLFEGRSADEQELLVHQVVEKSRNDLSLGPERMPPYQELTGLVTEHPQPRHSIPS
jgi:hypothetical protein